MHLDCPQWLEKFLKFTYPRWLNIVLKLSTMVGESFQIYLSLMAKYVKYETIKGFEKPF